MTDGWTERALARLQADRPRIERILLYAAEITVETPQVSTWFRWDEKGTWELEAARLLELTAEETALLQMSEAVVDAEIAYRMALAALKVARSVEEKNG